LTFCAAPQSGSGNKSLTAGLSSNGGNHTSCAGRPWPRKRLSTTSSNVVLVVDLVAVGADSGSPTGSTAGGAGTTSFLTGVAVKSLGASAPSAVERPARTAARGLTYSPET
jgi:hypothetical protein